jgi:predicted metalloprotease with PDZ domain
MKKFLLIAAIVGLLLPACTNKSQTGADIMYDVRFPNAGHNEAEITLSLSNMSPAPVHLRMSRTSPGRYALHEFAKNVYNVRVTNSSGDTLKVERDDLHSWTVPKHDGTVNFTYTLYANRADGTYSGVNREHAHLNMPATFAWASDFKDQSITVRFHPPEDSGWKAATQLKAADSSNTFTAPDFYYFMDSPTELSDFGLKTWTVPGDTTNYTTRLALHHEGSEDELNDYADMAQKVVAEQIAVYGEPPAFDYGTYTFIADYLPYVHGDGMEHRNSTILTSKRSLADGAMQNLGTLSHEFFHAWNVERIRPESLEPFNFSEANVSGALWFAEGFTSYYDDLIIRRTGLTNDKEYAQGLAETLNSVLNVPGSNYYSPVEMSRQAPFVDAASSIDQQNKSNTFISYYSWGAVLGLGLDLTLRSKFDDVTLDDYMRAMWVEYGKPEKPYTLDDLQTVLAELTESPEFAEQFFERYIHGQQMVDLKPLLANAGFILEKENTGQPVVNFGEAKIKYDGKEATISGNTLVGSPLYKAGLDRGDIIVSINGKTLTNARVLQRMLAAHAPGDSLQITYRSLGQERTGTLVLAENPTLRVVPVEETDSSELADEIRTFRDNWLGSKVRGN